MTAPRILLTISRSWRAWSVVRSALELVHERHPTAVLVHGDALEGDRQAAGIWRSLGGEVEAWPARWREHGDDCRCKDRTKRCGYAGFRRNVAMVESSPRLCLAFIRNQSKGATHCAEKAEDAGIKTLRWTQRGDSPVEWPPVPADLADQGVWS